MVEEKAECMNHTQIAGNHILIGALHKSCMQLCDVFALNVLYANERLMITYYQESFMDGMVITNYDTGERFMDRQILQVKVMYEVC